MAITVEARTEIISLVVGMFGAAPGASVLSDLVASKEAGQSIKAIAANLANTVEFKSIYPTFLTNAEFATKVVDQLLAEATVAAKAEAVAVLTAELNGGMTRSNAMVAAIDFVANTASTNVAYGTSATAFDNKVAVATYYSVDKQLSGASLAALQDVVTNVNSTAASVTTAKANISTESTAGDTFTLTTSATDVVNGTTGDDTIIGDWATNGTSGTVQASDFIDGGSGNDTLKLYSFGAGGSDNLPVTVKNVETINFVAPTGALTKVNTAGMSGVTKVVLEKVDAGTGTFTTGNGQAAQLSTTANTAAALTWAASATDTAASLTLAGFSDAGNGLTITGAATKTLNVNSITAKNTIALTAPASVTKLVVTGDKDLNLTAALAATVTTVDAAAATGGVTATLLATAATITGGAGADTFDASLATGNSAVTLGAGNDTLKMGAIASINASSSYNGGDGTDTVQFTDGSKLTTTNGKQFSGFEVLSTGAGTGVYNVEAISGITAVKVDGAITAATTIDKVTTQSVSVTATIANNLTVALKDATGKADSLSFSIGGAADVTASKIITAAVETVTVNSTKTGASVGGNTISSLDVTGATTLNFSGDHKLTVTAFASATTVTKIDASGLSKGLVMGAATGAGVGGTYIGGAGADTLLGNAKGDTFYGAGGGDTITLGGAGAADTVVIKSGADSKIGLTGIVLSTTGMDTVTAFTTGEDSFDLGAFGFTGNAKSGLINKGVTVAAATHLLDLATNGSTGFFNDGIANRAVAISNDGANTYVYIDANGDGNFSAATDAVIKLGAVTAVALSDFGF